ncbi:MAG: hypothetical protein CMP11_06975 [Zetaproteobacteria bacterium]|nr:hypothetical protein [Pseudobdellovibrionaceae bacterium]|tara:strand:+ start:1451 stop:2215 length:765 start_codon:yes stop_codon:yes gene_type:complete
MAKKTYTRLASIFFSKKVILVCLIALTFWDTLHIFKLKWGVVDLKRREHDNDQNSIYSLEGGLDIKLSKVSPYTLASIVIAEDVRFYDHIGIDFRALWSSFKVNFRHGEFLFGGSTITQQVVKVTLLSPEKTILRKLREIYGALILELILTKEEILSWYINIIYWGQGKYGLVEAADFYFNLTPDLLSINQSIQLSLILPAPSRLSRVILRKELGAKQMAKFRSVLFQLRDLGYITEEQLRYSMLTGNFYSPIK